MAAGSDRRPIRVPLRAGRRARLSGLVPNHTVVPDTKETREKKGRVKEQQLLESDIEEAVDAPAEPPQDEEDEELELDFEE